MNAANIIGLVAILALVLTLGVIIRLKIDK